MDTGHFPKHEEIGLGKLYHKSVEFRAFLRKVLSLHLLPEKKIPKIFKELKNQVSKIRVGDRENDVTKFMKYIEKTWIKSQVGRLNCFKSITMA